MKADEDIIAHQVNCQRKMNSGVAKQIRNNFPKSYIGYMENTRGRAPKSLLGSAMFVKDNGKVVAHLFAQENYGYDGVRYTSYEALVKCLIKLKQVAKELNMSVAIPYKMGCDRGGADWNIVYKMIEDIFEDYEITLYKFGGN